MTVTPIFIPYSSSSDSPPPKYFIEVDGRYDEIAYRIETVARRVSGIDSMTLDGHGDLIYSHRRSFSWLFALFSWFVFFCYTTIVGLFMNTLSYGDPNIFNVLYDITYGFCNGLNQVIFMHALYTLAIIVITGYLFATKYPIAYPTYWSLDLRSNPERTVIGIRMKNSIDYSFYSELKREFGVE